MAPAGVFSASALVCTALWAAFVALGLFAFLTVGVPREVFWVVIVQLAAGSRTVRKASYALAAIMTSRGYRGECRPPRLLGGAGRVNASMVTSP